MEHEAPFGDSPRIWADATKTAPPSTFTQMPAQTYRIRRAERQATFDALTRRHGQLANLRLALALTFAVMAWLSFARHLFAARWLAVPVVLFGIIGAGSVLVEVGGITLLQRSTENEVLGRVFAVMAFS